CLAFPQARLFVGLSVDTLWRCQVSGPEALARQAPANRRNHIPAVMAVRPRPFPARSSVMAGKPKVFVTRIIPEAGLARINAACHAEVWPDQLPPPYDLLRQKAAGCDGLVSLLTDKIDAALMDAAPRLKVVSNFAVGFNNVDIPAATQRG